MDEQRMQEYVELIQRLLGCAQGEEGALLEANGGLVDAGLVAVMGQYADWMESQGNSNAGWLRQFAGQLAQRLGLTEGDSLTAEAAAVFLVEIVQLIAQTQGDQSQVYGFFRANVKRLDESFLRALPEVFSTLIQQNNPTNIAAVFSTFGNLIQQFPLGNRRLNLELGITAYEQALTVRTQTAMPIEWATTTMNLANAYCSRIKSDRAENIEKAIDAYEQALSVRTKTAMPIEWAEITQNLANAYYFRIKGDRAENIEKAIDAYEQALLAMTQAATPIDWARTTQNLASAYKDRIKGDRAENIEKAIDAYEQALTVMTQAAMPIEWAQTTMNLASAYYFRIKGDRAENIEKAIETYEQALLVLTQSAMPTEWAQTTNNLATAYMARLKDDRAENMEQAIDAYERVLSVRTKTAMPIDWAQTTMNLANVYMERLKGDRAENMEQAIAAYEQALSVTTQTAMPIEWATTTMNLATAYKDRIKGDCADNIEKAINAYGQALSVMTKTAMPLDWATTTMNLANAYYVRVKGDRADNIEKAIDAYEQALSVRTQTAMPIDWAQITNNLATAYSDRIKGDLTDNLEQAIVNYRASLTIFKPARFPNDCRRTARSLANLYSDQQRWSEAISIYDQALEAAEILYQSATLLDSKSASLSETADLPRRAAHAFARTGDLPEAILTLEKGRARGLSETLDRDRVNLDNLKAQNEPLYNRYKDITQQLRNLEAQQRDNSLAPEILRNLGTQLRSDLANTIAQIRQVPGYEDFLTPIKWEDIQKAVTIDRPLVYLVTTPNGGMALTITVDGIDVLWLDDLTDTQLIDLLNQAWFATYNNSQTDRTTWHDTIDTTTHQLWDSLMGPIVHHLKTKGFDRATLIPTGLLSLLPLHAAWTPDPTKPTGRHYALDDIHLTYTPNAKSLTAARDIANQTQTDTLLAIDNPKQDLPSSEREIQAAIATFPHPTILRHSQATVAAVKAELPSVAIAHFSCHGTANLTDPLNSGLLMSDGLLTLKDLFALNLTERGGLRLAILSACETGLPGLKTIDEVISLPVGLMQAGVAGVIASLWSVSDLSTMLLLTKFYDLWRSHKLEPDQALRQAQIWLRDSTAGEIAAFTGLFTPNSGDRPYTHPYHWAAFSYTGI